MSRWGCSSSGRASDWQSEGREFKSLQLHNERDLRLRLRSFFVFRLGGSYSDVGLWGLLDWFGWGSDGREFCAARGAKGGGCGGSFGGRFGGVGRGFGGEGGTAGVVGCFSVLLLLWMSARLSLSLLVELAFGNVGIRGGGGGRSAGELRCVASLVPAHDSSDFDGGFAGFGSVVQSCLPRI